MSTNQKRLAQLKSARAKAKNETKAIKAENAELRERALKADAEVAKAREERDKAIQAAMIAVENMQTAHIFGNQMQADTLAVMQALARIAIAAGIEVGGMNAVEDTAMRVREFIVKMKAENEELKSRPKTAVETVAGVVKTLGIHTMDVHEKAVQMNDCAPGDCTNCQTPCETFKVFEQDHLGAVAELPETIDMPEPPNMQKMPVNFAEVIDPPAEDNTTHETVKA